MQDVLGSAKTIPVLSLTFGTSVGAEGCEDTTEDVGCDEVSCVVDSVEGVASDGV